MMEGIGIEPPEQGFQPYHNMCESTIEKIQELSELFPEIDAEKCKSRLKSLSFEEK